MGDGVYALDADSRYVGCNEYLAELTGYDAEETIGETPAIFHPDEDIERFERAIRELIRNDDTEVKTIETTVRTADDAVIPVEVNLTLLPSANGEFAGTVGVVRNVSDRKERERELERQNERLAEFANVVSHDLRNPLNVAKAEAEMLGEQFDHERLDHLQTAHGRMEAIIEDVLTLARQGEAVEDPADASLERVAEGAWTNVSSPRATLSVEADVTFPADARRLQRLLENLFRNAVEHGGGDVTVTLGPLDARYGFYVADDGPGMSEDEREDAFESGYTTDADGTGFGLAIVRRIADAHGWSVTLVDGAAGGARFEFAERRPS